MPDSDRIFTNEANLNDIADISSISLSHASLDANDDSRTLSSIFGPESPCNSDWLYSLSPETVSFVTPVASLHSVQDHTSYSGSTEISESILSPKKRASPLARRAKRIKSMPLLPNVNKPSIDILHEDLDLSEIQMDPSFYSPKASQFASLLGQSIRKSSSLPLFVASLRESGNQSSKELKNSYKEIQYGAIQKSISAIQKNNPLESSQEKNSSENGQEKYNSLAGPPIEYFDYFNIAPFDAARIETIYKFASLKQIELQRVEELLACFTMKTPNVYQKVKILCYIIELEKLENPSAFKPVACPYDTILHRFPIMEIPDKPLKFLVRTTNGKGITGNEYMAAQLQCGGFKPELVENLMHFDQFAKIILSWNERKPVKKIKRPLNSFMLYKTSIIKAAIALKTLNSASDLARRYYLQFLESSVICRLNVNSLRSPKKREKKEHQLDFKEELVLQLIEHDLLHLINSAPLNPDHILTDYWRWHTINRKIALHRFIKEFNYLKEGRLDFLRHYFTIEYRDFHVSDKKFVNIVSILWATESDTVKNQFKFYSNIEKQYHQQMYPDYKYDPTSSKKV